MLTDFDQTLEEAQIQMDQDVSAVYNISRSWMMASSDVFRQELPMSFCKEYDRSCTFGDANNRCAPNFRSV